MARPIIPFSLLPHHTVLSPFYLIIAVVAVLSILSLVTFLCASHRKSPNDDDNNNKNNNKRKFALISKQNLLEGLSRANNVSSKALLKMISWRKPAPHEHEEDHGCLNDDYYFVNDDYDYGYGYDNAAVWKKTIIMGERCRPFDFSGKIEYDSEGNLLPR